MALQRHARPNLEGPRLRKSGLRLLVSDPKMDTVHKIKVVKVMEGCAHARVLVDSSPRDLIN